MNYDDPKTRRSAERLLGVLLPKARAAVRHRSSDAATSRVTPRITALLPYLKERNLAGVYVYQDGGGWIADLRLKRVSVGLGDILGTPSSRPFATRAEAEQAAIGLIETVLEAERGDLDRTADGFGNVGRPTFDLDGMAISLEPGFEDRIRSEEAAIPTRQIQVALYANLITDFPERITSTGFRALPKMRRATYLGMIALLLSRQVLRLHRADITVVPDA